MMYRLIILTGPQSGQRITVQREPMVIGRDPDCAVCLKDDEVARKHAVLEHRPEGLFVRDLGSMNRILVNKNEVRETRLKHGDTIELGLTRLLVQALVQADIVEEPPVIPSNKLPVLAGLLIAVALLGAAGYWFKGWLYRARTATYVPVSIEMTGAVDEAATETEAPPPPAVTSAPPPSSSVVVSAASEEPMTEEIRMMRKDLAGLRDTVAGLATQKTGAGAPATPDPVREKALGMLQQARELAAVNDLAGADQILYSIAIMDPDFLPAYEDRARLFEKRGLPKQAMEQWSQVIRRGAETPMYATAVSERLRLAQAQGLGVGPIRIVSTEQRRLPMSEDYDEMRMLDIVLSATQPDQKLDVDAVRVDVAFFESNPTNGAVVPARGGAKLEPLRVEGEWGGNEPKMVNAPYVVPKGARAKEAAGGKPTQFYGYTVRAYYHDELQDQDARPRSLLDAGKAAAKSSP